MRLAAGSTILVPKTEASVHNDITENIIENAQMNLVADRVEATRAGS
jgi:membrane-bound lytic murein transglycosylase D